MSAKNTGSQLLEAATTLLGGGSSPAALLGKVLTQANHKVLTEASYDALIGKLVSHLQQPNYSIIDLFHDAAATKKRSPRRECRPNSWRPTGPSWTELWKSVCSAL